MSTRKESLCVEKYGGRICIFLIPLSGFFRITRTSSSMVRWLVLETGGSPLALRGTKNCGDKSISAEDQCCLESQRGTCKERSQLWKSNYHREKSVGWEWRKSRHVNSCYYKLAVKVESCELVCSCLLGGRPSAATSTAQHDRHYSEEERVREGCCFSGGGRGGSDTTKTYWERKRKGRLRGLGREGWRWRRICVNVSVPHKPQVSTALIPELPKGQCSTDERQGRYRSTVKAGKKSIYSCSCRAPLFSFLPSASLKNGETNFALPLSSNRGGTMSERHGDPTVITCCNKPTWCDWSHSASHPAHWCVKVTEGGCVFTFENVVC